MAICFNISFEWKKIVIVIPIISQKQVNYNVVHRHVTCTYRYTYVNISLLIKIYMLDTHARINISLY